MSLILTHRMIHRLLILSITSLADTHQEDERFPHPFDQIAVEFVSGILSRNLAQLVAAITSGRALMAAGIRAA